MDSTLRHVGIVVENYEIYLKIFCEVFGFSIMSNGFESGKFIDHLLGIESTRIRVVKLKDSSDNVIELIEYEGEKHIKNDINVNTLGITHFALNVQNIEDKIYQLENINVKKVSSAMINQTGQYKVAYVRIGNNFYIELVEEQRLK